ncbi:hypothetical protein IV203_009537 [Nitzschia inconspicua]|uniref:Uncharacterized protein n=1 Tax=Nitzschia inconspicua TaxID=303405 RepID=A0A9K3KUV8_9STRA|nr:hypothetical protein IV203_009537 [Nitzschia inconspicua]
MDLTKRSSVPFCRINDGYNGSREGATPWSSNTFVCFTSASGFGDDSMHGTSSVESDFSLINWTTRKAKVTSPSNQYCIASSIRSSET